MARATDLNLFESYLTPVLKTAYGVALYLTHNGKSAEGLVRETARQAYLGFAERPSDADFKTEFLRLLTQRFLTTYRETQAESDLSAWEKDVDVRLARCQGSLANAHAAVNVAHSQEALVRVFALLPVAYRAVCALYFLDERSYREIAEIVGEPVEIVRTRLHRGRRWLHHLRFAPEGEAVSIAIERAPVGCC